MGYEVDLIDYNPKSNLSGLKKVKNVVWRKVRFFLGVKRRWKRTDYFRVNYLNINNDRHAKFLCLGCNCNIWQYDKYVVGSDQVWNPLILGNDLTYLLPFVKDSTKKVSYAASFGSATFPAAYTEIYHNHIKQFSFISVREKSGLDILDSMHILNGKVVLDPTFLLSRKEWLKYKSDTLEIKKKYVLCYLMPGNLSNAYIVKNAKLIASKLSCDLKIVGGREYKRFFASVYVVDAGPSEFLSLIEGAFLILTNSFHGTCFSINFEKRFVSIVDNRGNVYNRNSRIVDLLNLLELKDQLYSWIPGDKALLNWDTHIDYKRVRRLLDNYVMMSKDYLSLALADMEMPE